MDPLSSDFDFNMLSLEDLLQARDFFHRSNGFTSGGQANHSSLTSMSR